MVDGILMYALLYVAGSGAYGSNYYVLLIPAGAIICLAIKRLSDIDAMNKKVTIKELDDCGFAEVIKVEKKLFQSVLGRVRISDNHMLAVKGMAIKLSALADAMANESRSTFQGSDQAKVMELVKSDNGVVHRDLICSSNAPYLEANARSYYDWAIKNGLVNIRKKMSARKFLKSCGFVCYIDLCKSSIKQKPRAGCTKIGVLNNTELRTLTDSETLYNAGNALMLFLKLNKAIEVIKC